MDKKKNFGKINLIVSFIILAGALIAFFVYGAINNNTTRDYSGIVNKETKSFYVTLDISKSWANNEGSESENWGEQFDFAVKDLKEYKLANWSLTLDFNDDKFELLTVDDAWNVDYKVDGKKLIITPHKDITLVNISPKEANTFGFILILKNKIESVNFVNFNYTLSGKVYRTYVSYPIFWVLALLTFTYIAFLIAYIVIKKREKNFEMFKEQSYSIISQSMNTFASLIDTKDPYTKDHSGRVSYYAVKIARKLGLKDEEVKNLAYIALMHDCGKLVIPDELLTKPAKLTPEEYSIMKEHTTYGGKALENFTSIKDMHDGALYHHEKWNGTGYPKGLKGEEIPLCARIIGVADALDAMNSDRCYRKRLSREKILTELRNYSGVQFDPKIATLVINMINNGEIQIGDEKEALD